MPPREMPWRVPRKGKHAGGAATPYPACFTTKPAIRSFFIHSAHLFIIIYIPPRYA